MTYVHPELGFALDLPAGAEIREDVAGIAVAAVDPDPEPASRFRANLTVTVEPVPPGAGVEAYTDASLATQDRVLAGHRLIDRSAATLRGGRATRTLAHHTQEGLAITIEQWRLVAAELANGDYSWDDAPPEWRSSIRELAVTLQADWPGLGITAS